MNAAQISYITFSLLTLGSLKHRKVRLMTRRLTHRALRTLLYARSQPYPFLEHINERTLIVAPHQDDSALGCGGLIVNKRLSGAHVHVAYVTDGSASHPSHPQCSPEMIRQLRKHEAGRALKVVGVDSAEASFLDAPDGRMNRLSAQETHAILTQLTALFTTVRPTELFLPYRHDGSSEHEAIFCLVEKTIQTLGLRPRLFEYPVWAWWSPALLTRPLLTSRRVLRYSFEGYEFIKHNAINEYRSQIEPTPPWKHAVLPDGFVSFFHHPTEYFFEL